MYTEPCLCGKELAVIDSVEQSASLKANIHSTRQEIPYLLWNSNVRRCAHKNLLPVPVLS